MSQSRELKQHIGQITDICSILTSMKNLALIEVHKLTRYQILQGQAVENIEQAALDFLDHHPQLITDNKSAQHIIILAGTERGFCGDFNQSLIAELAKQSYSGLIAIGGRLISTMADSDTKILAGIDGANVAEEVRAVINRLLDTVNTGQLFGQAISHLHLTVFYHETSSAKVVRRQLLPPFASEPHKPKYPAAPMLNLAAQDFFPELVQQYLFAVLHEIFYKSLMAENQKRLQHLEGAVKHLEDEIVKLQRKSQIYRQEEITEEIEVILLNTEKY